MPLFRRRSNSTKGLKSPPSGGSSTLPGGQQTPATKDYLTLQLDRDDSISNLAGVGSVGMRPQTSRSSSNDGREAHYIKSSIVAAAAAAAAASSSAAAIAAPPSKIAAPLSFPTTQEPLTSPSSPRSLQRPNLMSRSKSQPQALPYHRPWTRHLRSEQEATGESPDRQHGTIQEMAADASTSMSTSSSWSAAGAPNESRQGIRGPIDAAYSSYSPPDRNSLPVQNGIHTGLIDFRVSPNAIPPPTAAQKKQMIDTARRTTLKKAKAPSEYNILVMGGRMTGKTSWIRTLLSTLDLENCSEEAFQAASSFGIATANTHATRETDPITPLSTKSIQILQGIELQPLSFVPLASLGQNGSGSQTAPAASSPQRERTQHGSTRGSIFSTSTSGHGSKRMQLSICDTPGIDFEYEDDFEIERKVSSIAQFVEDRLLKTMTEEGKIQRRSKTDEHIHTIIYFVDPKQLVERCDSRKREILHKRHGRPLKEVRTRTQSESHVRSRPNAASLKQGATGATAAVVYDPLGTQSQEEEEHGVEGLSPLELGIIARMSKYASVLPVIAKADTLSVSKLYEVRQAVRKSIRSAKIDLGLFDLSSVKSKKRNKVGGSTRRVSSMESAEHDEPEVRIASTTSTIGNGKDGIKVVRIRPRRSYSASGERPKVQSGSFDKEVPAEEDARTKWHHLQHTEPLFQSDTVDADDINDEESALEDFLRSIPPTLFNPEPMRTYRKKKSSLSKRPGSVEREPVELLHHHHQVQEKVPPVPPLPRETSFSSDSFESSGWERYEIGKAMSPTPGDSAPTPAQTEYKPPTLSNRFERNYRWGTANVLDPEQCDFGLIRTTILGTHAEQLKETTAMRYESFRMQRLELNRLLRQGKASLA